MHSEQGASARLFNMHRSDNNVFPNAIQRWSAMILLGCSAAGFFAFRGHAQVTASKPMSSSDQTALHSALDAYDRGEVQAAEPLLRDLARRYPKNYEACEALGSLYAESGDLDKALPYLQHAIVIAPRQAIAHANLGAAYIKLSKNADAVNELQIAARLEPRNAETQSNLGDALMLTGQPVAAAKAFAIASDAMPGNWDLAYNWALALYEGGAPRQAVVVLQKIPAQAMTDQAQSLAGDVNEKLGNYKEAIIHYQSAAQINPSDANLYTLTLELLRHWTWDEAIEIANFGATRYPDKMHFKVAVGIALYGSNKYPDAAAAFSKLLVLDPENGFYADLLGRSCSLIADGVNPDCNGLEDFARRHPENAGAATYAAVSILHHPASEQDTAKAEQLLNQAIAADPKLPEAYYQLGVLEQQRLHWKESSVALEKAIALRPTYAQAHYRLSRAYAHMGMRDDAQKQMTLQQQYSQKEKDNLDLRMQEMVTFLLKPS
jgi:tetratricopeptide (TPR) repeat protein